MTPTVHRMKIAVYFSLAEVPDVVGQIRGPTVFLSLNTVLQNFISFIVLPLPKGASQPRGASQPSKTQPEKT